MSAFLLLCVLLAAESGADADFERAMALARESRWREAREALLAGQAKAPGDKRFPIELAGVAFREKKFSAAKSHLRAALRLDRMDAYANDFLATLYFLEDNLEAALKYWNRAEKPRIEEVRMEPEPAVDPVLLDRAFAFAPGSVLRLEDVLATRARLEHLGIFARFRFDLAAGEGDKYGVVFRSTDKSGLARGWLGRSVSLLRGLPYQAVYPELYNAGGRAVNLRSMLRWDAQKRRAAVWVEGSPSTDPGRRIVVYFDGRNENWDMSGIDHPDGGAQFNLRKAEAGAEIRSVVGGRWSWMAGLAASHRSFRNAAVSDAFFPEGFLLKYRAQGDIALLRLPERRLLVTSNLSGQFGKMYAEGYGSFYGGTGALRARWFPRARGEDYETRLSFRAGKIAGDAPFDERYILGAERDNDLWLRGHVGTRKGRKGSAPLGFSYVLLNWETDKIVYTHGFFGIKLGPFLDSGKAFDKAGAFGASKWMWDAGVQCKLQLPAGASFVFLYGKDLRSGRNAFYFAPPPQ